MKTITKKRINQQRTALQQALSLPLPDETIDGINDAISMLTEINALITPNDKFTAAAEVMVALGYVNAKQAKQHLEKADNYRE